MNIQVRFHKPSFTKKALAEYSRSSALEVSLTSLLGTLTPEFRLTRHGLYLVRPRSTKNFAKIHRDLGKFNSEGLVNHIHLSHLVKNPVYQFKIGVAAIRLWQQELERIGRIKSSVIFLNEASTTSKGSDFILCIYSDPQRSELQSLEKHWKRKVSIATVNSFLKWAARAGI
jgi:hypothetical protein